MVVMFNVNNHVVSMSWEALDRVSTTVPSYLIAQDVIQNSSVSQVTYSKFESFIM